MLILGQDEMAKYPFMADAGQYLGDMGFSLEQFGTDPDLKMVVDKAFERIQAAVDGQIYKTDIVADRASSNAALPREVFSFILAIVLLKLCGMPTLVRRFALAEARRAEKYLERDLATASGKDLVTRIIYDLFAIKVSRRDDFFVIPVPDYLRHSVNFYEREWKLVNRYVDGGMVFLTPHETIRLIRADLTTYIRAKINNAKMPEMHPGFVQSVDKLVSIAKKFSIPVATSGKYPPCIKHAINILEKGENLPHSGRFMLATFLLSKGKPIEGIAPLFKNAPDYNEKITLYQLNHLSGASGSGTKYSCPSCEKLRTQGLCFATSECDGIITPLHFGTKRA